jgi:uncharacterized protein
MNTSESKRHRIICFAVAASALSLYAVIDGFVAPAAGTTVAQHLVPVLVPIAIVALAIAVYSRVGPTLGATIAVTLGIIELAAGLVALADLRRNGIDANDWICLPLLAGGVVLCVIGARLVWSARRGSGHRVLRASLMSLVALVLGYYIVMPVVMAVIATHRPHTPLVTADLGRDFQDVSVETSDGLRLDAWYVPSRNGAAVITYPREWTVRQARMLASHGYGVLALDMRGYGTSQGETNAFGWGAAKDLDAGVSYLLARADVHGGAIGGLGISVGGEQLLEAAAGNRALRAVVSEGTGFRSVRDGTVREGVSPLQVWLQLPADAVQTAAVAVLSGVAPSPGLQTLLPRIAPRPVFLIYGQHDNAGELALTPAYYHAARQPKMLWMVPGASHTQGIVAQPSAYEEHVVGFFDRALLTSECTPVRRGVT